MKGEGWILHVPEDARVRMCSVEAVEDTLIRLGEWLAHEEMLGLLWVDVKTDNGVFG